MKTAFPTDDRISISKHTGKAKEFAVYELSSTDILNVEYIENQKGCGCQGHGHHGEGHSHKGIVNKLTGIDSLFVSHVGKHFKQNLEEAGVNYEITNEEMISDVLKRYFNS
jgi:predicted Fe-Mo cluster-binding NifX family protein